MNFLAFILHHANRYSKEPSFYAIKDKILNKYGKSDGYDIQHIPGKKCRSCGGTGKHWFYSNTYPYKAYDYSDCWHCFGGWFKLHQWICLERRLFGGYIFHKPLKREFQSKNPWTAEGMGWEISNRPIIENYIDHKHHWFGRWATLILYWFYDRKSARNFWKSDINYRYFIPQFIWRAKWSFERWQWRRKHPGYKSYVPYNYELEDQPF